MRKLILLITILSFIHNTPMGLYDNLKLQTSGYQNLGVGSNAPYINPSLYPATTPSVLGTTNKNTPVVNNTTNQNTNTNTGNVSNPNPIAPTQPSGGGGSGKMSASQALAAGIDINQLRSQGLLDEGMGMGDLNAEVENSYNAGMGAWNVAEQNANKDMATIENQLTTDEAANTAQLGTDKTSALGNLATQGRAGQTRKEDALAAARRLFSELQMANRQRFGGSTSAGGFASEIQGAELQRNQGQTNRQANEFFQQIETAKNDVESKFTAGLAQIKQQTQQLLTQAKLNFSNMITQIAQGRAQTEQQKSQMRITALMNLRNEAFQVQQQKVLAEQSLTQMREQAKLNIEAYQKTTGAAKTQGANAYSAFDNLTSQPASYSQIQSMSPGTTGQNTYVGSIKKSITGRDQYGNYTYSDNTSGPGAFLNS